MLSHKEYEEMMEKIKELSYVDVKNCSLSDFLASYNKFVKIQDVRNIIYEFVSTASSK